MRGVVEGTSEMDGPLKNCFLSDADQFQWKSYSSDSPILVRGTSSPWPSRRAMNSSNVNSEVWSGSATYIVRNSWVAIIDKQVK